MAEPLSAAGKRPRGRPRRNDELLRVFPEISRRTAAAVAVAIGLDFGDEILDPAVWDDESLAVGVAAITATLKTTAQQQRAEKSLRRGVANLRAAGAARERRDRLAALDREREALISSLESSDAVHTAATCGKRDDEASARGDGGT